jgi:transcription initiation factor TFIIIB Brf1 subunit/transcription initiation factor TFIIB
VCTNCGVVGEERIPDDRPEWREFNDADDLAKGLPAAARCGMVPVDETRYLGGLQPTTLSSQVFGGGTCAIRKRLLTTNRKLDIMMQKQHARALKTAKVSRQARQRHNIDDWEEVDSVRPDYDHLLLQEEEDAQRSKDALYAEKWSIDRAILLHGQGEEETSTHGPLNHGDEGREELLQRLDAPLQRAAADVYQAYTMLQSASRKLHLPDRVLHETTAMMCRYATRRDGITVKGVSSRVSSANKDSKEAVERLRDYNKQKQTGALASALLFLTARKLGWTRSLAEVCFSFQPENVGEEAFIKPKHCSKAMNEVRAMFPQYGRAGVLQNETGATDSTGNFCEYATQKLELPPVAVASIRTLVQQFRKEQMESETTSMAKLSTICASISLLVCLAGASLQRLAQQAQHSETHTAKRQRPYGIGDNGKPRKRTKVADEPSQAAGKLFDKDAATQPGAPNNKSDLKLKIASTPSTPVSGGDAFDVFSHSAVEDAISEKRLYEMRRIWDAWSEQMPWFRSVARIEQSCGVSRNAVLSFYKTRIFPRRHALLDVLQNSATGSKQNDIHDSMLQDTPLASVLLRNIAAAAPLLNSKGQL